jgi:AraC-like DNA-binding protein
MRHMENNDLSAVIHPFYARLIVRHLTATGIQEETLLQGTGLGLPALWRQSQIDIGAFKKLLTNAEELYTPAPIGFLIGQHQTPLALGPLGVAMGVAPTLREGLQILGSFTKLHASYIRVEPRSGLRNMTLTLNFFEDLGDTLRYHIEATLMFLENYIESVTGQPLSDAIYYVAYPPPEYALDYLKYLRSPVKFDQPLHRIVLPSHWLDMPSPYFHDELWHQSLQQLSARIKEVGKVDREAYSNYLQELLRTCQPPLPQVAEVAQQLNVSIRTLNRRLALEGTSFRVLRNTVIDRWACDHLRETKESVESISASLGYQDPANFRRAFRTRMGVTPQAYRDKP